MNKKKNIIIIVGIIAFILIIAGVSYSFFVYNKNVGNVSLNTGDISIDFSNTNGDKALTNVIPMSNNEGKINSDYFDFTVNATVDTEKIYYEVYILPKTGNTLDTSYLKTYLTDQSNNEIKEVRSYSNLLATEKDVNGKVLYKGLIELNNNHTTKNESRNFRLRMWLDENYPEQVSKTFEFDIYLYAKNVAEDFVLPEALNIITRNVITSENPINFANISSSSNGEGLYILPGTENDTNPIYYYRGAVNNNNVIFGDYCWQMVRTTDTGGIKMIYNGSVTGNGQTCENTAHADRVLTSNSAFNSQYNTVADVGYMKNTNARYGPNNEAGESGAIYGKNVEWDGTNYLVIEDTAHTASANEIKDNNHHYSCGTQGVTSCGSIRYYYYNDYYILLTDGELIEDAIYKMTGNIVNPNIDVVTRNQGYVLNQNDSTAKTIIENWFRTNLTNEVDNTKRNYLNYLEDTVYCNDRSFKTISGSNPTYLESGWNPNGGDLTNYLYFGTSNRFRNNLYNTSNVPSVACPNETDRFSVSSSVAHLNYPVGLLTVDEIIMAGAGGTNNNQNTSYYLYTENYYWSLSPCYFGFNSSGGFYMSNLGSLSNYFMGYSISLRPVVSLKYGTEFESGGDGTPTKPYVVKYE